MVGLGIIWLPLFIDHDFHLVPVDRAAALNMSKPRISSPVRSFLTSWTACASILTWKTNDDDASGRSKSSAERRLTKMAC